MTSINEKQLSSITNWRNAGIVLTGLGVGVTLLSRRLPQLTWPHPLAVKWIGPGLAGTGALLTIVKQAQIWLTPTQTEKKKVPKGKEEEADRPLPRNQKKNRKALRAIARLAHYSQNESTTELQVSEETSSDDDVLGEMAAFGTARFGTLPPQPAGNDDVNPNFAMALDAANKKDANGSVTEMPSDRSSGSSQGLPKPFIADSLRSALKQPLEDLLTDFLSQKDHGSGYCFLDPIREINDLRMNFVLVNLNKKHEKLDEADCQALAIDSEERWVELQGEAKKLRPDNQNVFEEAPEDLALEAAILPPEVFGKKYNQSFNPTAMVEKLQTLFAFEAEQTSFKSLPKALGIRSEEEWKAIYAKAQKLEEVVSKQVEQVVDLKQSVRTLRLKRAGHDKGNLLAKMWHHDYANVENLNHFYRQFEGNNPFQPDDWKEGALKATADKTICQILEVDMRLFITGILGPSDIGERLEEQQSEVDMWILERLTDNAHTLRTLLTECPWLIPDKIRPSLMVLRTQTRGMKRVEDSQKEEFLDRAHQIFEESMRLTIEIMKQTN